MEEKKIKSFYDLENGNLWFLNLFFLLYFSFYKMEIRLKKEKSHEIVNKVFGIWEGVMGGILGTSRWWEGAKIKGNFALCVL